MLLTEEPDVEWWEQMVEKRRVKRDKDESIPSWDSFNVNEGEEGPRGSFDKLVFKNLLAVCR